MTLWKVDQHLVKSNNTKVR